MKRINLEIKALSPLAIGRQKPGGSVSEAESYIPGTVIRGAIAAYILKRATTSITTGDNFHDLFLGENPAIFQNAYPAIIESKKQIRIQPEVKVVPATALSSKTKSGFKSKGNNGVFDTLIDRFCAEGYGQLYDPNCPTDGGRVDVFTGFYSELNGKYYSHSATTRLLTRVGINRRRATSEERVLYSIEVLNESQSRDEKEKPVVYTGAILVVDELANSVQTFINDHQDDLRLGGSVSRGLGRVKITAKSPVDAKVFKPSVEERINKFQNKLHQRWDEWKRIFVQPPEDLIKNRTYFSIALQSDAILRDNWRYTTVISENMLQQFAEVTDSSLKLHAAYSSYDYLSGWNSAWGLMKDVELITNKGGVYLFSTTQPNLWMEKLTDLEANGVGDRTCEGFGQIQVCNEFHLILREEAK
ncbi:MAG TPA: CRISPR-associated RAMP protein Csx10 [Cyanobacteria bacterium UBA8553]|nr:CRISPR-associated RAMP protein Csx10 [Cyanobacteria bacterium UBA8553]HAJ61814.1 CRISPR-associated RAMP protein Csx10 [Cyanobacteria bacterium UBA8543]